MGLGIRTDYVIAAISPDSASLSNPRAILEQRLDKLLEQHPKLNLKAQTRQSILNKLQQQRDPVTEIQLLQELLLQLPVGAALEARELNDHIQVLNMLAESSTWEGSVTPTERYEQFAREINAYNARGEPLLNWESQLNAARSRYATRTTLSAEEKAAQAVSTVEAYLSNMDSAALTVFMEVAERPELGEPHDVYLDIVTNFYNDQQRMPTAAEITKAAQDVRKQSQPKPVPQSPATHSLSAQNRIIFTEKVDLHTIPLAIPSPPLTVGERLRLRANAPDAVESLGSIFTLNRHNNNNAYQLWAVNPITGVVLDKVEVMGWHDWDNPGQNLIKNGDMTVLTRETLSRWVEEHPDAEIVVVGGSEREAASAQQLMEIAVRRGLTTTGGNTSENRATALTEVMQNPPLFRDLLKFLADNAFSARLHGSIYQDIAKFFSLHGANLVGANLKGVDLQRINLSRANLTSADLTGANLTEANLTGATLQDANLTDVEGLDRVKFENANLRGAQPFTQAFEQWETMNQQKLTRQQKIRQAADQGIIPVLLLLSKHQPKGFESAWHFSTNLQGADLKGVNLPGVSLSGVALPDANLMGANLPAADLFRANLSGADLTDADLSGANLVDVNLPGANLTSVDLTGTRLYYAYLSEADLTGADLTGANLSLFQRGVSLEMGP